MALPRSARSLDEMLLGIILVFELIFADITYGLNTPHGINGTETKV